MDTVKCSNCGKLTPPAYKVTIQGCLDYYYKTYLCMECFLERPEKLEKKPYYTCAALIGIIFFVFFIILIILQLLA
jgi:DNA-directed RNA polymerase subunit RPC12/RpoP